MTEAETRAALIAYKEAHGMGIPLLASRIKASGCGDLPLKSLQRFLSGEHRMNESFLSVIETHLSSDKHGDTNA